jgi:hypothetical protein
MIGSEPLLIGSGRWLPMRARRSCVVDAQLVEVESRSFHDGISPDDAEHGLDVFENE